ncbi:MAG: hypothetical protein IJE49_06040 [Agathobacter sp.]|nr:hypothetical protein [Agathobacter sp.]
MKKQRMGHIWLILAILCALTMSGCGSNKTVEGSEKTYSGVVTDCAMSVVKEGDRTGRPYIIISTADGTEICFWMKKNHSSNAQIGDTVTIESAIERETNLLVATKVTVEETYFRFSKEDFIVVDEADSHGGFHGDGSYYLILDCSENKEKALENVKGWKELPLSSNLQLMMYGDESGAYGYNLAEVAKIPEITNGYYYFCDRHSQSSDANDDTNVLNRASFNFIIAIYDSDTGKMYYFEFDT